MKPETRLAHAGRDPEKNFGIVNPPVYRGLEAVEDLIADLETGSGRLNAALGGKD